MLTTNELSRLSSWLRCNPVSGRYNFLGWTNYETWNVKLWMDNDESTYRYWQEQTHSTGEMATIPYD